jgi:hypothetical protein
MDREDEEFHYHIRWSRTPTLDWECFSTRVDAEASAKQLVLEGESYTIEEHGEACPRCRDATKAKSMRGTSEEAGATNLFSRQVIARVNASDGQPKSIKHVFQIAYDEKLFSTRAGVLSVLGNETAKAVLWDGRDYDLFIVGHASPPFESFFLSVLTLTFGFRAKPGAARFRAFFWC